MWWLLIPAVPLVYWLIGYFLTGFFYKAIAFDHMGHPCTETFRRSSCNGFHNMSEEKQNSFSKEYKEMFIRKCSAYNSSIVARLWPINLLKYLTRHKMNKAFMKDFDAYLELKNLKKRQAEDEKKRKEEEMKVSNIIAELRLDGVANLTPEKFDVMMNELDPTISK